MKVLDKLRTASVGLALAASQIGMAFADEEGKGAGDATGLPGKVQSMAETMSTDIKGIALPIAILCFLACAGVCMIPFASKEVKQGARTGAKLVIVFYVLLLLATPIINYFTTLAG